MANLEPVLGGDDTIRRNFSKLDPLFDRTTALEAPSLSTALPSSPFDGQVIYYDSGTAGVVWTFRYNASSASSFKWEFVGGPSLLSETQASSTRASATYGDLAAGAGPSVTVPLAGDWDINHGATAAPSTAGAGTIANMSYAIGGTAAVDADAAWHVAYAAVAASITVTRTRRKTGLTASTALVTKYRCSSGTGTWQDRWIQATPVRVG